METTYNKFCGIDISDMYSITFIWTNTPFFTDYIRKNGKPGNPELRMEISLILKSKLDLITKEYFIEILSKNGLIIDPMGTGMRIALSGYDLIAFFHIIENIK